MSHSLFRENGIQEWREGDRRLHLFIDSLDECLLRIDTHASLLPEELRKQPVERLSLRIACRTAVWPALLENELLGLWGKGGLGVYELAPLRRRDVRDAAIAEGLASDGFMTAVERAEIVPFATRPVTLGMLIKIYRRGGGFPATKWELYDKGTRLLTEELNESRVAANRRGRLSPDQRLAIAGRIAAATIFCNRFAVWKLPDGGDVPAEDVQVGELAGQTETAGETSFEVTPFDVEEVLDTGLFSSRGVGRMGWSHQTYAEFLAARYVLQHDLATPRIFGLLRHPGEMGGKIVPQLEEVAAWIAMRRMGIFDAILRADPTVLLRSDIATSDEQSRDKVVSALLDCFENNRAYDIWSDLQSYRKLANSKLAERLLPYIRNRAVNVVTRRAAILIAEACEVKKLGECLLGIALDGDEDEHIRAMAVSALSRCGSDDLIKQLRPLVTAENAQDSQDEIRGSALKLLWPQHLTAAELFAALQPKKRPEFHGSYSAFMASRVTEHLQPGDMAVALDWVIRREGGVTLVGRRVEGDYELSRLSDEIVLAAFELSREHVAIRRHLVKTLVQRLRAHYFCAYELDKKKFEEVFRASTIERRLLIEALVSEMTGERGEAFAISRMIAAGDFPWLIESAVGCDRGIGVGHHVFTLRRCFLDRRA